MPRWVDAREFQKAASDVSQAASEVEGQTGPAPLVTQHLKLYSGDLLADLYDDWIAPERDRLHALYIDALLRLTQTMRSRSEYGRAVEFAQQVLERDRANERAHQHLMFCYLAMGNRTSALRQYEECRCALKEELGVEPSAETTALYDWVLQTPSTIRSDAARITNLLIPASSFIGRAQEIAQVKRLLEANRLVTCTGIGGCGKTRLALQVATDLIDAFRDGVWWIELGPLTDERLVPQAIAKALGIWERPDQSLLDTVCQAMGERKLALVIDNCEHLVATCAQVTERLLGACPQLRILATSRHALGVAGETVFQVPSLSYPESDDATSLPMAYESVRLFTERARAFKSDFQMTGVNVRAVAQICRQLDGIPLAIELAAARVQALTAVEIAANLDDLFTLLTLGNRTATPRQQTLRASMDWSYRLLTAEERRLFNRLAVFVGGFTFQAGQVIVGGIDRAEMLDLLTRLVQKSLVSAEPREGTTRYHYQETVRLYAREKLVGSGEAESVGERHAGYFAALVEEGNEKLRSSEQAYWLDLLDTEYDNVRAALSWAHANQHHDIGLRLAGALSLFWFLVVIGQRLLDGRQGSG
jgi:predicted ATPase